MINYFDGDHFNYGVVDNLLKTMSAIGYQETMLSLSCTSKKIYNHYKDILPLLVQDWRYVISSNQTILKIVPTKQMWLDWVRDNELEVFVIHDRKTLMSEDYTKYTKKQLIYFHMTRSLSSKMMKNFLRYLLTGIMNLK